MHVNDVVCGRVHKRASKQATMMDRRRVEKRRSGGRYLNTVTNGANIEFECVCASVYYMQT